MSLEAVNQRKSPVTLAVTAGYFFSLKKIMRENIVSAIQRTVCVSKEIRKKKRICNPDIFSLSLYYFISDEWKITTDIIRVRAMSSE
jgi:hypothetical protein